MAHDFKKFPELTNSQMEFYYFSSPHKQITEDFRAEVIKVHDGDTITVRWRERDFDFPVRFIGINAPELSEGGRVSRDWLANVIEGEMIDIKIDKNQRVGKFGRLLGSVNSLGMDLGETMVRLGLATPFDQKDEGTLPNIEKEVSISKWL